MRLRKLAEGLTIDGEADPDIRGLTEDSRRIGPGMLFVAIQGLSRDGHDFVGDAVQRGAAAVVVGRDIGPVGVPVILVESPRAALARLAARFYGNPADDLRLIGFTGTFGKTSTSEILRALLAAAGRRAGVLGSLGARYGTFTDAGQGLTTPAPVELHRALWHLRAAGADTVIMEVTSHALRLDRIAGLALGGGLLAAIRPGEHTDFHRTYEDYVEAKRRFLAHLAPEAVLAYDADNRAARALAADAQVARRAGVSTAARSGVLRLRNVTLDHTGARFTIDGHGVHSALLGRGHVRNVALALAYALADGVELQAARQVLHELEPLRRRMERYEAGGRTVLDDTAAHPDSLEATFEVAELIRHGLTAQREDSRLAVVHAVRGSRGADINRRNALALAVLAAEQRAAAVILTASTDAAGPQDRATDPEIDAVRQALDERGVPFAWHDTLAAACRAALDATRAGDLIVLAGAQGMERGKELLTAFAPPSRPRDTRGRT